MKTLPKDIHIKSMLRQVQESYDDECERVCLACAASVAHLDPKPPHE